MDVIAVVRGGAWVLFALLATACRDQSGGGGGDDSTTAGQAGSAGDASDTSGGGTASADASATADGGSADSGGSSDTGEGPGPGGPTWPIGIPRPEFGVDELAGAVTLVVDDANPLPDPIPAGAVIEIQGSYGVGHTSPNGITCAGTADAPAFIRGAPDSFITGGWEVSGSYCILEQLSFGPAGDAVGGIVLLAPADHIALRDSDIAGNGVDAGGTGVVSWQPGMVAHDVVLLRNTIHDGGDVEADFDQDVHGIAIGADVHHVWVVGNEMARNSGDGIQINAGPGNHASLHHIYVGLNVSHDNKQTGFWVKQAQDVIFSQNAAFGHRPSNSSFGACMGFQYGPERVWMIFNYLFDCEVGIGLASNADDGSDGVDSYIVGNVISNIHDLDGSFDEASAWRDAGMMLIGGVDRRVVHNTIHDVVSGIRTTGAPGSSLLVSGNIVSASEGNHLFNEGDVGAMTVRNNLTDVALRQVNAACEACVTGEPGFTDPAAQDFTVGPDSAARDIALEEEVYGEFESRYGESIRVTPLGDARPLGDAWDAGAFEAG
ncbi:MAG: right-handed parallel beta-helix repeat-containing protein [Nannocystaceae bacterium]